MIYNPEMFPLYSKLINSIISKYTFYFDREDLFQVGFIGLMKALKNYNEDSGSKFSSYAYFYIEGEVKEYVRVNSNFKLSKDMLRLKKSYEKAKYILAQNLKRMPSISEICNFLNITINDAYEIEKSSKINLSLDEVSDDASLYDYIGVNEDNYNPEIIDLKTEIDALKEPDKTIIKSLFLEGLTQNEVSNKLGISQVKVSRKEKEILTRLRKRLK